MPSLRIFVAEPEYGTLYKIGRACASLQIASQRAAALSLTHGVAEIRDESLPYTSPMRIVMMFRAGRAILDLSGLEAEPAPMAINTSDADELKIPLVPAMPTKKPRMRRMKPRVVYVAPPRHKDALEGQELEAAVLKLQSKFDAISE